MTNPQDKTESDADLVYVGVVIARLAGLYPSNQIM